jgi:hypothetical protein
MSDRDDFNRQRGESLLDRVNRTRRQLRGEEAPPATRPGPGGEVLDLDELVAKLGTRLGPFHQAPALFMPYHLKVELLRRTFAGVELGGWDQRVLSWLANADGDTVVAVAGMIHRAMTDAAERAADLGEYPAL